MSKEAAEQVSHWVHDAESLVTVQRIVQTFDLSWSASLSLLKEIPRQGNEYTVTVYSRDSKTDDAEDCSEVLRLVTQKWNDKNNPEQSVTWCALALKSCNESIQAAYERDRAQFHDTMAQIKLDATADSYNLFAVPEPLKKRFEAYKGKRSAVDAFDDEENEAKPTKSTTIAPLRVKKKTTTSAKSFFANKTTTKTTSTTTTSKAGSKGKTSQPSKAKQSSSSFFKPKNGGASQPGTTLSAKGKVHNKKGSADEEKENVRNKASKVGNADDFVGDADDDDDDDDESDGMLSRDDDEEEVEESKPAAANDGTTKEDVAMEDPVEGSPMETEEPEKAASSSQATAETETKHRRRRKKMVEQTFTDENGYIYTETKAVWEDVPSDEEEQFPVPSKKIVQAKGKKPIKKPSKQGSITSFFGKPKKK